MACEGRTPSSDGLAGYWFIDRVLTVLAMRDEGRCRRASVAGRASACSAARARIQRRSARRLRYGTTYPAGRRPSRTRVTARRSARRTKVRASSRVRAGPRLARDHELVGQLDARLALPKQAVQPRDHRRADPCPVVLRSISGVGIRRQLGADHEQVPLDAQDDLSEPTRRRRQASAHAMHAELRAGDTEGCDGLVDGSVCLGASVVLGDPLAAEEQARRPVIATAGRHGGA